MIRAVNLLLFVCPPTRKEDSSPYAAAYISSLTKLFGKACDIIGAQSSIYLHSGCVSSSLNWQHGNQKEEKFVKRKGEAEKV